MRSRPAVMAALLPVLLLPIACGGDDGAITAKSTTTAADGELDPGVCDAIEGSELPDDFADLVPERFADTVAVLEEFQSAVGQTEDDLSTDAATAIADALGRDGVGEDLVDLGAAIEEECGESEGAAALRFLGGAAPLAATARVEKYCAALEDVFAEPGDGPDQATIDAAEAAAPGPHRAALERLAAMQDGGVPDGKDEQAEISSALMGLGLYGEARCGIDGAFAQMMIGAAFLGMASSDEGAGDTDGTGGETGVEPTAADPGAADAAAPSGTSFEVVRVDLEDDGEYLASVVVPAGWTQDDTMGVSFDPPAGAGSSIFTSLDFSAGCDGLCQSTDWEARLRGGDGYLTMALDGWSVTEDRAPDGSEGAVITATRDDGEALVIVIRWDDDADRYFSCRAEVDADDAALGPSLLAACEAARPGWIPVS